MKPEFAGKVLTTPCCDARIKMPAQRKEQRPPDPKKLLVKCHCGQSISLTRPSKPVEIRCPKCQNRMRLGSPTPAPTRTPAETPLLGDDLLGIPLAPSTFRSPPRNGKSSRTKRNTSQRRKANRSQSKTRLPRYGLFDESMGIPALVVMGLMFLLLLGGVGSYLIYDSNRNMAKAAASESWQATQGKILQSDFSVRGLGRKRRATVTVGFRYNVGGKSYTGNRLSFEKQDSFRPRNAEALLKPYPKGSNCMVYYNPNNPSDSVLIKGARSANNANLFAGVFFLIAGMACCTDCCIGAFNAR